MSTEYPVTALRAPETKAVKVMTYSGPQYVIPVYYTINGESYKSTYGARLKRDVGKTIENLKARIAAGQVKATLNERGIEMIIQSYSLF